MWNDISPVWQTAFREMWTAFREGSVPIGAVLCDAEGSVILSDRNRNHAAETVNRRIADVHGRCADGGYQTDPFCCKGQLLRHDASGRQRTVLCVQKCRMHI